MVFDVSGLTYKELNEVILSQCLIITGDARIERRNDKVYFHNY